jgi:FHS family glucose/mannose:H+ symporter-like MFS transporter
MYRKKLVFWAACTGMLMFGISVTILGSIIPDLKEKFHLDEISSGTLFSILPLGVLTGSLLFGPVVDKYGYRIIMAISCIFIFIGFEGIAYVNNKDPLKIFIFLFGIGGGAVNGATNALVADISDRDKGARLSILGAFFGIGALGMPLLLGILRNRFSFEVIVAAAGIIALMAGIFFILISYPPPKQAQGFPFAGIKALFRDKILIMIAFFLFFQSSFEGILNNWTTTWLSDHLLVKQGSALFGLSSFVAGMIIMRLMIGSLFISVPVRKIMLASFSLILAGLLLLETAGSLLTAVPGLVLTGAGLAAGFPVMLGITGERFKEISGTAFSFVLSVALIGNMLINYLMGVIAQNFGISHLVTVAIAEMVILASLCFIILNRLKNNK